MNEIINNKSPIYDSAFKLVNEYLAHLDGEKVNNLNELYLEQIEPVLFEIVMERAKYNQSRAAKILGISRGTLRKKLKAYFDDKYVGERE